MTTSELDRHFESELVLARRQALQDAADIAKRQLGGQATPKEILEVIKGDLELLFPNPKPKRPELGPAISAAGIDFYPEARVVFNSDGERKKLTPQEFILLGVLISNAGRAVTFEKIARSMWGCEVEESVKGNTRMYVTYVREKIDDEWDPERKSFRFINAVYGVGYKFSEE